MKKLLSIGFSFLFILGMTINTFSVNAYASTSKESKDKFYYINKGNYVTVDVFTHNNLVNIDFDKFEVESPENVVVAFANKNGVYISSVANTCLTVVSDNNRSKLSVNIKQPILDGEYVCYILTGDSARGFYLKECNSKELYNYLNTLDDSELSDYIKFPYVIGRY